MVTTEEGRGRGKRTTSRPIMGIDAMCDVASGTHICHLYQTKEDLIDILVPFLKAGLQRNEFCMWVTSDPLGVQEARGALGKSGIDLDAHMARGQMEVVGWGDWYMKAGEFEGGQLLQHWLAQQRLALAKGFRGLRVAGNMSWLGTERWQSFMDHEALFDRLVKRCRTIALCSYSLENRSIPEIVDVVTSHRLVLVRRAGKWELIGNMTRKPISRPRGNGLSYSEIGRQLGLTSERVRQLIKGSRRFTRAPSDLITVGEAARLVNVHANTIRRWSDNGILKVYYLGPRRDRRFRRRELDHLLRKRISAHPHKLLT